MAAKAFAFIACALTVAGLFAVEAPRAQAASLNVEPSAGTFQVGATFTVNVAINTQGDSVNAFETVIRFPADKLQVISPATGPSIVGIWVGQPTFDNHAGTIVLRGGIPNGITTSHGVIAAFEFRTHNVGDAYIQIDDDSQVLANDGSASNVLQSANGAVYHIVLPPSAGPRIASPTHPDQTAWYPVKDATLTWIAEPGANGYSYVLSQDPMEAPDNISEGARTSVSYDDLQSGTWYFAVKALRDGVWGDVSHFALHVDRDPPADFIADIVSGARTTEVRPVVQFLTTDELSGIDHYELKLVPLSGVALASGGSPLFIEAQSPYVSTPLALGAYDVIVRAFDKAGNYRDTTKRLEIVAGLGRIAGLSGLSLGPDLVVAWKWVIAAAFLLLILAFAFWYWHKRRHDRIIGTTAPKLPPEVQAQLEELRRYREKYAAAIGLLILICFAAAFGTGHRAFASSADASLPPPITTDVSKDITNQEVFYIGGKAEPGTHVLVHIQNAATGGVLSETAAVDPDGNWFYRHSGFLSSGDYILWAQAEKDGVVSVPSPQSSLHVEAAAFEFGVTRVSYAAFYLIIAILLLLWVIALLASGLRYGRAARAHKEKLLADVRTLEERVRLGFAMLRKDVQAELAILNGKDVAALLPEEKYRAAELQEDIDKISAHIGEDVWELQKDASA